MVSDQESGRVSGRSRNKTELEHRVIYTLYMQISCGAYRPQFPNNLHDINVLAPICNYYFGDSPTNANVYGG